MTRRRWMPHVRPDQDEPPEPVDADALQRAIDEDADRRLERRRDEELGPMTEREPGDLPRRATVAD